MRCTFLHMSGPHIFLCLERLPDLTVWKRETMQNFLVMQQSLVEAESLDSKWARQNQVRMNALLQLYRSKGGSFGDEE